MTDRLLFLLDASGSMSQKKEITLMALNEYVKNIAKDNPNIRFTLIQWDSERYVTMYDGAIAFAPEFSKDDYLCRGYTPLLDVFANGLDNLNDGYPGKRMLTVFTDGLENASKYNTYYDVKNKIEKFRSEGNVVYFLGADIDAWEFSKQVSIPRLNTMSFDVDESVPMYRAVSQATSCYFSGSGSTNDSDKTS